MNDALPLMRCDLHVHSIHSGPATLPALRWLVNECYSSPQAVYERARQRGMNLVTLTDHDTIAGALELAGRPDTFVSEEVTVLLEGGRELHLGVYDITEAQHQALQARRNDLESLFAYAAEQRIPVCVNHPFSALTGRREDRDLPLAFRGATHVEVRNGMMSALSNDYARAAGRRTRLAPCGGSDAHTLASVARAYTIVRGARDKGEYLDGLRRCATIAAGHSGSYARLTADIFRIVAGSVVEAARPRSLALALRSVALLAALPLGALVPLATLVQTVKERVWAEQMFARYRASLPAVGTEGTAGLGVGGARA
jgi:predicted metal-dependent phosphoesterase TrpH